MQVAIALYPGFTALDAIGPHDVLAQLPDTEIVFVAETAGPVRNDADTFDLVAGASFDDVRSPDIVVVPGGPLNQVHAEAGPLHAWLRDVDATADWMTSVCTGSLVLGVAGLLKGRRATSHWLAVDFLAGHGAEHAAGERVVFDGKYITAAGVSAGIDFALTLAGRLRGDIAAQACQLGIEYDPQPPYDAGSPEKAPAEAKEALLAAWAE
ncbi:DJ-1/PfpI family protein [Streptomyces sp. A7024]|uniref:DJ-1/PfpI family protein n=1 Tax=Streptomyces coryli TaxID=1128680 RepID=A0A6G4TRN0_9ACTN|nr:DJ-1/PfpI family protein [Streptomyces coryli]NGN62443.1 DJ-1/PfpI family protein [Streptomyces coryli]